MAEHSRAPTVNITGYAQTDVMKCVFKSGNSI